LSRRALQELMPRGFCDGGVGVVALVAAGFRSGPGSSPPGRRKSDAVIDKARRRFPLHR